MRTVPRRLGRRAHDRRRLALERLVRRPRGPVDGVLQDAGHGVVVLGGDDEQAVGGGDGRAQAAAPAPGSPAPGAGRRRRAAGSGGRPRRRTIPAGASATAASYSMRLNEPRRRLPDQGEDVQGVVGLARHLTALLLGGGSSAADGAAAASSRRTAAADSAASAASREAAGGARVGGPHGLFGRRDQGLTHRELAHAEPDEQRHGESVAGDLAADGDRAAGGRGRGGRALDQPQHGGVQRVRERGDVGCCRARRPSRTG